MACLYVYERFRVKILGCGKVETGFVEGVWDQI